MKEDVINPARLVFICGVETLVIAEDSYTTKRVNSLLYATYQLLIEGVNIKN